MIQLQTTPIRTRQPGRRVEALPSQPVNRGHAPLQVVDGGSSRRPARSTAPAPQRQSRTIERAAADLVTHRLDQLGEPAPIVVVMMDIDGLDDIGASKAAVGDEPVAMVAERIATATRSDDLVLRVGHHRFIVVRSGIGSDVSAARFVDRIRRTVTGRLAVAGRRISVSVVMGFTINRPSVFDGDRSTHQRALDVLNQSHEALRDATGRGPGHMVRFHLDNATADDHETATTDEVITALRRGELTTDFEPVFCPSTGDTLGAKTVVRWHHPTNGVLEAHQFMATAFRAGISLELGDWLLTDACATTRRWLDEQVVADDFAIHVDVTGVDIGEPTFVDRVDSILRAHRLRPHQLVLEVTEHNLALCDTNGVCSAIRDLRRKGVKIAIDNFRMGSGAQSIATTVGADILRLDTSDTLTNDTDADTNIAQSLVTLAHGLGMKVVAESVRGVDQLRRLRSAGCDLVHGALLTTAAVPATAA